MNLDSKLIIWIQTITSSYSTTKHAFVGFSYKDYTKDNLGATTNNGKVNLIWKSCQTTWSPYRHLTFPLLHNSKTLTFYNYKYNLNKYNILIDADFAK